MLWAQAPSTSPQSTQVEESIALKEKAIEAAKKQLLAAISRERAALSRSRGNPDARRRSLEAIDRDRRAFEEEDRLPTCDELLAVTMEFVERCQRIWDEVERLREKLTEQALQADDPDAMANLAALEDRLNALAPGRDEFTASSTWSGRRSDANGAVLLDLRVKDVTGNGFRGQLSQTGNYGRADEMEVEGSLRGNHIEFRVTRMILGRSRKLIFDGHLVGGRIFAKIAGTSVDGRRVTGSVTLSRKSG